MAFNILDVLKNDYNNFYNSASSLIWTIDGKKYTSEELNDCDFSTDEVKESFYVEIEPNSAINLTGHSSFEYSFRIGVRKIEYQGIERWLHDGYFLILDDDWWNFYEKEDALTEEAIEEGLAQYEPALECIYFDLHDSTNLYWLREFQIIKANPSWVFKSFEESLPTLSASFNEAMKGVFTVYDCRRSIMGYYEHLKNDN